MKTSYFAAVFSVIAASACGPGESVPPHDDAGTPPSDAGAMCEAACVPFHPAFWYGPALVWMGDEAAAPPCPATAPFDVYSAHGYVEGPMPCDACTCGPTSGSCEQSEPVTAAAASCANDGTGVEHTSSDLPVGWVGSCNAENAIPAGKLCGGVPCVQSITIGPLRPKQTGCLPMPNINASPPPWNRFARACSLPTALGGQCPASSDICTPAAPGPEFKQCILYLDGYSLSDCPSTYPEKSVFYQAPTPKCGPCACDVPDSTCTGSISLYQGDACDTEIGAPIPIDAAGPVCVDVPPGSALGSKSASSLSYQAGTCKPSGGAPNGAVFCCQP